MAGFVVASIITVTGLVMACWLVCEVAVGIRREDNRRSLFGSPHGRASRTARRWTGAFARHALR